MSLTTEEREVILTWDDASRRWHVYSDSQSYRSALIELCQRAGITPEFGPEGSLDFDLAPGRGISLPRLPIKPTV